MTNKERLVRADSIKRRQNAGQLTPAQASEEFDLMLMQEDPGTLIYCSDSTGITAPWNPDVMLFPTPEATEANRIPSNTGIYARGPKRGILVTHPAGEPPTCHPEMIKHFDTGKGWEGHA